MKRVVSNAVLLAMALAPFLGQALDPLSEGVRLCYGVALALLGVWSARYVLGWSWPLSFVMFVPGFVAGGLALFMWCIEECGWWKACKSRL